MKKIYINEKATTSESFEALTAEIEKVKKDFNSPQFTMMESQVVKTYYLSRKDYDKWFGVSMKEVESARAMDAGMAESMLIQTAYRISMDPQFVQSGLYPKVIELVEGILKEDAEILPGYYCLACLYKAAGNMDSALKNINKFIEKAKEKGQPDDQLVNKLKE